ncbi:MAG: DUF350 domain-containing protein [Candidatus Poribacteria bacterium]|nr:DUF350 domain-containing protein [Candidatus Poribacteria bacterium]
MELFIETGRRVAFAMPHFAIAFVMLLISKWVYDLTTPYNFNDELTENDNPAFGVCLAGYLIGSAIAMGGALSALGTTFMEDLMWVSILGAITVVLMRVSVVINDKLILTKFSVNKEMFQDRNVGTGFVVAGSCVATGFVLNGVFNGHSDSMALAFRDILVYWVVGQLILIVGALVFQAMTNYDVHGVIEGDDNAAAGISFGGYLVALGIVARAALMGATSDLAVELTITAVYVVVSLVLLAAARVVADLALLPKSPLTKEVVVDKNMAAGAVAAASFIMVAALLSGALRLTTDLASVSPTDAVETMLEQPDDIISPE